MSCVQLLRNESKRKITLSHFEVLGDHFGLGDCFFLFFLVSANRMKANFLFSFNLS